MDYSIKHKGIPQERSETGLTCPTRRFSKRWPSFIQVIFGDGDPAAAQRSTSSLPAGIAT